MLCRAYYKKDGSPFVFKDSAGKLPDVASYVRIVTPDFGSRHKIQTGVDKVLDGKAEDQVVVDGADGTETVVPGATLFKDVPVFRDETDAECEARCFGRTEIADPTLAGLPYIEIDRIALPADRSNRNGWKIVNGALEIKPT